MLLHKCVMEGGGQSEEFIIYMEKKIMSRLAILARHKKVLVINLHFIGF